MIPSNLIFINVCPYDLYFQWQQEVLITNFREFGISSKMEILVWYPENANLDAWQTLQKKYPEVKFFYYQGKSTDLDLYIPRLRPYCLAKHFQAHGERLTSKVFFYHDSDILFNYLPDFEQLCKDDINWQSDTSSYLDYDYIIRKEAQGKIPDHEALNKLAEIGEITPEIIKSYSANTGGAQYILKSIGSRFWEDVERMSLEIRTSFAYGRPGSINTRYFKSESEGYQSWVADMWALNFSLWKRDQITSTTPLLDFSWATDTVETYKKKPIFHNAGVSQNAKNLFYKGAWINKSPIGKQHRVSKNFASSLYVEALSKVK